MAKEKGRTERRTQPWIPPKDDDDPDKLRQILDEERKQHEETKERLMQAKGELADLKIFVAKALRLRLELYEHADEIVRRLTALHYQILTRYKLKPTHSDIQTAREISHELLKILDDSAPTLVKES